MITVPQALTAHVTEKFGTDGARWLRVLPARVREFETRWQLSDLRVHPGSNRSLVATANHAVHGSCYLKLEPPGPCHGPTALAVWARGGNAPAVLQVDHDVNAYLVVVAPGRPLVANTLTALTATPALARVIHSGQEPPIPAGLPRLSQTGPAWAAQALDRLARVGGPPLFDPTLLAEDAALLAQLTGGGLLHGDLVPQNVLFDGARVQLIDPDPMVGPAERDLANWCLRASWGEGIDDFLAAVRAAVHVDAHLLSRLVRFSSRTYTAYCLALGRPVPAAVASLAKS